MAFFASLLQAERTAPRSLPADLTSYQRREMGIAPYRSAREQCYSTIRILLAFVALIALLAYGIDWLMAQDIDRACVIARYGFVGLAGLVLIGVGFGLAVQWKER